MILENYLKWMLWPLTRYGTKQLGGASKMRVKKLKQNRSHVRLSIIQYLPKTPVLQC